MATRTFIYFLFAISVLLCSCEKAELATTKETYDIPSKADTQPDTIMNNHPKDERDGSAEYPFHAGDIAEGSLGLYLRSNNMELSDKWIVGYIVGYVQGTSISKTVLQAGDTETNIVIADDPAETEAIRMVPVQLSTGSSYVDTRNALNLSAHPENLHAKVLVFGKICTYMSTLGIKNTRKYSFSED